MKDLKYYVLWKKDSPLLKEYLEKYYNLLLEKLEKLKIKSDLKQAIESLLSSEDKKDFIMNADNSSLINYLYFELIDLKPQFLWNIQDRIDLFLNQIDVFLREWISSSNLTMNKWTEIPWTKIKLTSFDNSPYNKQEAHPDHVKQWAVSWNWWEKTEKQWLEVYKKSFDLLKDLDEWIYDELNQIITKIVPLWTARWTHNSASYKEVIGHLYMWYTVDAWMPELNNLEAIIHESSHNKLNLLFQFDPIVLNSKEEKYYSAIRPDARHLHWVFLWVHAFAPTIYILSEAIKNWYIKDDNWLEKFVLYTIKTKFLYKVIAKHAKLSEMWQEIFAEVKYVIWLIDENFKQINPSKDIIQRAKERQIQHFNEVNKSYPYLEY